MKNKSSHRGTKPPAPLLTPRPERWLLTAMGVMLAIWVVGGMFPAERTWGFSHLAYLPLPVAIAAILAATLLCLPVTAKYIIRVIESVSKAIAHANRFIRFLLGIVVITGVWAVFYYCTIPFPFLGDATLRIANLYRAVDTGVVPDSDFHSLIASLLFFRLGRFLVLWLRIENLHEVFRIITSALGIVFTAACLWYVSRIGKQIWDKVLLSALLFGCGGMLFFFGYVELYAPVYLAALLYCFALYRWMERQTSLLVPIVFLLLAIAAHTRAVFFIPSFIWALYLHRRTGSDKPASARVLLRFLFVGGALFLIVYIIKFLFPLPFFESLEFSPWQKESWSGTYTLFSVSHLLDVPNGILLSCGFGVIVLITFFIAFHKHIDFAAPATQCFIVLTVSLLALIAFHNPILGMARDWDIYTDLGLSVAFLTFLLMQKTKSDQTQIPYRASAIFLYSLVGISLWISSNTRESASLARYQDILSRDEALLRPDLAQYACLNLWKYYDRKGDTLNAIHTSRRMIEFRGYPWDYQRFVIDLANVTEIHAVCKDIDAVVGLIERKSIDSLLLGVEQGREHTDTSEYIADQFVRLARFDSASIYSKARLDAFTKRFPDLPHGDIVRMFLAKRYFDHSAFLRINRQWSGRRSCGKPVFSNYLRCVVACQIAYGYLYNTPHHDSAAQWFAAYCAIDSENVAILSDYSVALMNANNTAAAERVLSRALSLDPSNDNVHFNWAVLLLRCRNDKERVRYHLQQCIQTTNRSKLRSEAEALLAKIAPSQVSEHSQ